MATIEPCAVEPWEQCYMEGGRCENFPQCSHITHCPCCDTHHNNYTLLTSACQGGCRRVVCDFCFTMEKGINLIYFISKFIISLII